MADPQRILNSDIQVPKCFAQDNFTYLENKFRSAINPCYFQSRMSGIKSDSGNLPNCTSTLKYVLVGFFYCNVCTPITGSNLFDCN